jgi:hypothetical protein
MKPELSAPDSRLNEVGSVSRIVSRLLERFDDLACTRFLLFHPDEFFLFSLVTAYNLIPEIGREKLCLCILLWS